MTTNTNKASDGTSSRPSDKPTVDLNLDTLEREGGTPEPFRIVHGGRPYVLADPNELDWQVTARLGEDLVDMMRVLLGDDYAEFAKTPLPMHKLNRLADAWRQHYGLPAPGEVPASPTS